MERLFLERDTGAEIKDSIAFCCGEISDRWFAAGNDSLVYRWGDQVIKVYKVGGLGKLLPEEKRRIVGFYVDITNRASLLAEQENWQIELPSNKVSLPVMVVPVLRILSCSFCNTPATISKFIEGPNLDDIGMNRKDLPFDIKELPFRLSLFSLSLREKLAYDRVSVIPRNVKFQSGFLIITDLCVDLSIFRG